MNSFLEHSPAQKRLRDALLLPEQERDELQQEIQRVVQSLTANPAPDDQFPAVPEKLQETTEFLMYLYCSPADTPLPSFMNWVTPEKKGGHFEVQHEKLSDFDSHRFPKMGHLVEHAHINERLTQHLENNDEEITSAYQEIIRSSAEYRFFSTLLISASQTRERSLTLSEKHIRDQQIKASIRHRFASELVNAPDPNTDGFPHGSAAQREYRRESAQLELETRHDTQRSNTGNRIQRFLQEQGEKHWFTDQREYLDAPLQPGERIRALSVHKSNTVFPLVKATTSLGRTRSQNLFMCAEHWDHATHEAHAQDDAPTRFFTQYVLEKLIQEGDRCTHTTLEDAVERAATHAKQNLYRSANSPADPLNRELLAARRSPGTVITHEEYARRRDRGATQNTHTAHIHSFESVSEDAQHSEGRARRRGRWDNVTRLIRTDPLSPELPAMESLRKRSGRLRYDTVLELSHLGEGSQPAVEGYEVVAHNPEKKRWALRRLRDDPHTSHASHALSHDGVQQLVQSYRTLGLHTLADHVEQTQQHAPLSVQDLAVLVQRNSVYTFDTEAFEGVREPHPLHPQLSEFAGYVHNDELHTQCTGAASFMAASLGVAAPHLECTSITGLTLGKDTQISRTQHAQLMVSGGEHTEIVDSTPPAPPGMGLPQPRRIGAVYRSRNANQEPLRVEERTPPTATQNHDAAHTLRAKLELVTIIRENDAQRAEQAREVLLQYAESSVELKHKQSLADAMVQLPEIHPARMAYVAAEFPDVHDPGKIADTLEAMAELPPHERRAFTRKHLGEEEPPHPTAVKQVAATARSVADYRNTQSQQPSAPTLAQK